MYNHTFYLSEAALIAFKQDGFLQIPTGIPNTMLQTLRALFDELMNASTNRDKATNTVNGRTYITNLEKLCSKGNLSCLELLGAPYILGLAESICGNDFFLIQEFAVIKMLGDNLPVLWHQDMLHQRTGNCFTMGIYLDDAPVDDGALLVVPGSHANGKSICESKNDPTIAVPMKAGDILLHDMMLAHSSGPMHTLPIRRVIYFEFLSVSHVRNEKLYTENLLHQRCSLMPVAIEHYKQLHPAENTFEWKSPMGEEALTYPSQAVALQQIYEQEIHAIPSTYCFEGLHSTIV
ncbi:MAG: phytanoyl-CoA dioxygenase family protein [Chitinophagaceae bacterium]